MLETIWTVAVLTWPIQSLYFWCRISYMLEKPTREMRAAIRPLTLWVICPIQFIENVRFAVFGMDTWYGHVLGGVFIIFQTFICLVIWADDVDDDYWKKKRKKALAKVKVIAGKLVVVPTPAPSPA